MLLKHSKTKLMSSITWFKFLAADIYNHSKVVIIINEL